MVTIDELHSDVTVAPGERGTAGDGEADRSVELRIEELREVVRELLLEEYERALRTGSIDRGGLG